MPAYDGSSHTPPAPVAQVQVRSAANGPWITTANMLIDTGADVTLLPRTAVGNAIDSAAEGFYELEGFDGTRSVAQAVRLELMLQGYVFRGRFLIIEQDYGVLGRNVLNSIALVLDGPNLSWNVQ